MEILKYLFQPVMLLFNHDFTLFGFTFSFFDIFILSIVLGIVGKVIYNLFDM